MMVQHGLALQRLSLSHYPSPSWSCYK